jgi:hypothetical protein
VTDLFLIPAPWPPEDPKVRALGERCVNLSPEGRVAWVRELLAAKSPDLDLLLSAFNQRNPDPDDAAQAMAHHLVEGRQWAVLHLMCRHFAPPEAMPVDATSSILDDLYCLRQFFWTDPLRSALLTEVIDLIQSQWKRPPGYEQVVFE